MTEPTAMHDEQQLEARLVAKGLTHPRIKPSGVDDQIDDVAFHVFLGTTTTVCCITLRNGFTVIGEGACASPENFDKAEGESIAFINARDKIWQLEGYLLKDNLWRKEQVFTGERTGQPG